MNPVDLQHNLADLAELLVDFFALHEEAILINNAIQLITEQRRVIEDQAAQLYLKRDMK